MFKYTSLESYTLDILVTSKDFFLVLIYKISSNYIDNSPDTFSICLNVLITL